MRQLHAFQFQEKQAGLFSVTCFISHVCLSLQVKQVMHLSTFVLSTTMRCDNYSRWELISFSSLYPSCLLLLAEGFDRYLPSSGFLFSVWEWFLQHTASLIYLKMQCRKRSMHAYYIENTCIIFKVRNFSPASHWG